MALFAELKRRNVFKVALFYVASSWFVLQVADLLFDLLELPSTWLRLVLAVVVLGFPVALIVSWVYELTSDGLKRESEVDRSRATTAETGHRLSLATIGVLVLAAGLLLADRFLFERPPAPSATAITGPIVAVLPFLATGSDDGGFLAAGLHDDLLTRLAKVGAFRVISRTSVKEYAETSKNLRQIGEELGAGYILEGAVQARGERVRVNAQLIDAASDQHLWAHTYDRELTAADLFDIQAELARAIANGLELTLSGSDRAVIDRVPTRNTEAYSAFLRGLEIRDSGGHSSATVPEAVAAFEQAVGLDPEFALAWAQLSIELSRYSQITFADATREAALAAHDRAHALQPDLPEVELASAVYQYRTQWEYEKALRALEALETKSALDGAELLLKAFILRRIGRIDEAYLTALAAQKLDPRSVSTAAHLITMAWETDRCADAGRHARAALALAPDAPDVRASTADYELECNGDAQRADMLMRNIEFTDSWHKGAAVRAAHAGRDYQRLLELSETREFSFFPESHLVLRVIAFRGLGRDAEASEALDAFEVALTTLDATDENGIEDVRFAWARMHLHALRGDARATADAVEAHRRALAAQFKGNRPLELTAHIYYAQNLARVGLDDEALEELRVMFASPGSPRFPSVDSNPALDGLKDHPGYAELRERFSDPE